MFAHDVASVALSRGGPSKLVCAVGMTRTTVQKDDNAVEVHKVTC